MPKTTNRQPLFIHVPKAAGGTIWESLDLEGLAPRICWARRHGTLNYFQTKVITRSGRRTMVRRRTEHNKKYGLKDLDRYWIIGSVRNPWKRIVSLYRWTSKSLHTHPNIRPEGHGLDFKTWLYKPVCGVHYRDYLNDNPLKQVNYFIDKEGEIRYDEIIRTEHLENDIRESPFYVGKIESVHVEGTSKGWREMYDEEDIEYVRKQSLWEIEKFGYKFKEKD